MSNSNTSTVRLDDGREVCLSYGVPVAAFIPGTGYIKTSRKYSVTTSRHANQFCGDRFLVVDPERFASLIAPVVPLSGGR